MKNNLWWRNSLLPMLDADGGGGTDVAPPGDTDSNPSGTRPPDDAEPPNDAEGDGGEKTLTQADVDRIVKKTIEKERARAARQVEEVKTEAEKLAKMNADQRAEYERQQRETQLAEREAQITRRELMAEARNTLSTRGLPQSLADVLVYTDADGCNASIDTIEKAFRAAVQDGVNERLKGAPPPQSRSTQQQQNAAKTPTESVNMKIGALFDKKEG